MPHHRLARLPVSIEETDLELGGGRRHAARVVDAQVDVEVLQVEREVVQLRSSSGFL